MRSAARRSCEAWLMKAAYERAMVEKRNAAAV
jgi:hypothetical protein